MTEENPQEEQTTKNTEEELLDIKSLQLEQEMRDHKEKYMRLLADTENTRKRMQKEKQDMTRFAVENIISEFLAPLDNLENALGFANHTSEETKNWAMGFQMILTQFKDILTHHNVSTFESKGHNFDPHLHEAIEMEETDTHEEGIILQEFIRGYKCGERILRPARVKVAKVPKKDKPQGEEQTITENKDKE
ncbi:MAG: nucleotide exchange factor GrpE [Simkaniaceae bacterium]|nr:nucleotide exchange factor GrpE [Simkaniaceae bacterium]